MLLKRRDRAPFWPRLREVLWPRKGVVRPFHYARHRLRRLPGRREAIGLGVACGVFWSFSPFFGLHLALALGSAWMLRANLLAAALGTLLGNPVTLPLIGVLCVELGRTLLGSPALAMPEAITFDWVWANLGAVVWPWALGGTVLGAISAALCYGLVLHSLRGPGAPGRAGRRAGSGL